MRSALGRLPNGLAALLLLGIVLSAASAQAQRRIGEAISGNAARRSGDYATANLQQPRVRTQTTAFQQTDPHGRFGPQMAADRAYLDQNFGSQGTPLADAGASVDLAASEPVIDYDEYVSGQADSGGPGGTVVQGAVVYPADAPPISPGAPGVAGPSLLMGGGPVADPYSGVPASPVHWFQPYGTTGIEASYLLWWIEGFNTPPLVTTSPTGTDRTVAGVLGEPGTSVLAGGGRMVTDPHSGGRLSLGYWLDSVKTLGIDATFMGLASVEESFSASSTGEAGSLILARPFFNVEAGFEGQDAELIAFPGLFAGNIQVHAETSLEGVEVLLRRGINRGHGFRTDFLVGWRFNHLDDELVIRDFRRSLDIGSGLAVDTTLEETDRFSTQNWFNGAEFGLVRKTRSRRWTVELGMKLALGNTRSEVAIDGSTTTTVPLPGGGTDVDTVPYGLLAQETNIGVYRRDELALVSELGVMLGFDLTPNLQAKFGYNFMYWSRVARPGDQVDFDLNLTQLDPGGLVGNPRPRFDWVVDDLWAQGLNFALEYRL